jgi:hypothetical protein
VKGKGSMPQAEDDLSLLTTVGLAMGDTH